MPPGRFENQRLLLLGVGSPPSSRRQFDIGGIGTGVSTRVFDVEQPPVSGESIRLFDITGVVSGTSERVFDVEGLLSGESERVFDVVSAYPDGARYGLPVPAVATVIRAFGGGGAAVGATTVTVDPDTVGLDIGSLLNLDGEYRVVTALTATTVTFVVPLGAAHPAGRPITTANILTTRVAVAAEAGDIFLTVEDLWAFNEGSITLGGTAYAIAGFGTDYLVLATPLLTPAAVGAVVQQSVAFLPTISVYDKAGWLLGLITRWTATAPPSHMIGRTGAFEFYVPRRLQVYGTDISAPDLPLLQGDRLVRIGTSEDTEPWAGTMMVDQSVRGRIQIMCPDLFDVLRGATIAMKEEPDSAVAAVAYYSKAITLTNVERVKDGEVEWALDATGTRPVYGDFIYDAEPLDLIGEIATRSNTEYAWSAPEVVENGRPRLRPTLVVRDSFNPGVGIAFTDGADGNVARDPVYVENTAARINAIRLRGLATAVRKFLPEWAHWAVHEFEPYVEVSLPTGDYRRRTDLNVSVDWGLSRSTLRTLAQRTEARLRAMYLTFLYAYHDQEGRPYHEGYNYHGPPSAIERFLTTGQGWRTKRKLIEIWGKPATGVMVSREVGQILGVLYDRVTGEQTVSRFWFNETGVVVVPLMRMHGFGWLWQVTGGVIVSRGVHAWDHSAGIVGPIVTLWWPANDSPDSGGYEVNHPVESYHQLRRVINITEHDAGGEGQYIGMDPTWGPTTDPFWFTKPTVGDAPFKTVEPLVLGEGIATEAITTVYDFEDQRINDWDPRRDGVGAFLNRRTIVDNQPSTAARWHHVPWQVASDASTSLSQGISASATEIFVDSIYSLPGHDKLPYILGLGESPANEDVEVWQMEGPLLHVHRGRNGTTAIIHEEGTRVRYQLPDDEEPWDGIVVHQEATDSDGVKSLTLDGAALWPEGVAWATTLLQQIALSSRRLSLHVVNRNGTWNTVRLGSRHPVTLGSEGRAAGITGTVRVVGFSPDPVSGSMDVVVEFVA